MLLAVLVEGGLAALAVALGWLFGHRPLARFALDAWGAGAGLLGAVPMLLAFAAMARWPVGPLRGIRAFTDKVLRPLFAPLSVLDLLGVAVMAGVGEEMLFRGLLQDVFAGAMPVWAAVLAAAALFGVLHAVTPAYAVLATVMGAYLGALYVWSGDLLAPVVAHAVYDFVALLYLLYGPGSAEFFAAEDPGEGNDAAEG